MTRLLIISHTRHYRRGAELVGWGPTVREIDHLARLFSEVVHLAPLYPDPAPQSALPYTAPQVRLHPIKPAGGPKVTEKLAILARYPQYAAAMRQELAQADVVHVRCPANISLLALLLLSVRRPPRYRWIKYAGNWQPDGQDHLSYAWQRSWLKRNWQRGVVTVNGHWPQQPAHVVSFYNPCLEDDELAEAHRWRGAKNLTTPVRLLFVGAVNEAKGCGRVLQIAQGLHQHDIPFMLDMVGDGEQRATYQAQAAAMGLSGQVCFHGWLPRPQLASFYAQAHFLLLPSATEGWPKVLSEAMAYGVVPLAGAVGSIPQILAETGAGLACPVHDAAAYVTAIRTCLTEPERWVNMSEAGFAAAPYFTYSAYLQAVQQLFQTRWGLSLSQNL